MLTKSQLREKMLEIAPDNYPNYPYHNFEGHVLNAIESFTEIYYWLKDLGIDIDYDAGVIALAHHDRDYDKNPVTYGYNSKEELSASMAAKDLEVLGADEHFIKTVYDGIIATTADIEPTDNLQLAIVIADISNLFGDIKLFLFNTYLFTLEKIEMNLPIPDSFEDYCINTSKFLRLYFRNPLVFSQTGKAIPYQPMTKFALDNIKVLESITLEKFIDEIVDLAPEARDKLPEIWFNKLKLGSLK